jgi:histidinol dehydrogenase
MKVLKEALAVEKRDTAEVAQRVSEIVAAGRDGGDKALREFCLKFDSCDRASYLVTQDEVDAAYGQVPAGTLDDLRFSLGNIEDFARKQRETFRDLEHEVQPGVLLGHRVIPVDSCACYVPGGRYPLPSSALASIVPARVAGVTRIVACSPPQKGLDTIHPMTLVAMDLAGADEIYCMGGAQAVAALACGTETIRPVSLVVGPGNQYVTEAKRQLSGEVGIDFIAGPSEVLVIADHTADPTIIAADLLAQAEHDPLARSILVSLDTGVARRTMEELERFLAVLPTAEVAAKSWASNGQVIVVDTLEEAAQLANTVAPEHLEVQVESPDSLVPALVNYGSLFIGKHAAEVFGDYLSGTNHILPTMRAARFTGGLWVGMFLKVATHQRFSEEGVALLAPITSRLAAIDGLYAHKLAADVRLMAPPKSPDS